MSDEIKASVPRPSVTPDSEAAPDSEPQSTVTSVSSMPTKAAGGADTLNEDEKAQSRKTNANAFDQLVDANLRLVDGVALLVKVSYVVLATQVVLGIVVLVIQLTHR